MRFFPLVFALGFAICCSKRESKNASPAKPDSLTRITMKFIAHDTVVRGWSFHFESIGEHRYDSLFPKTITTNIPNIPIAEAAEQRDTLWLIRLRSGTYDTLRSTPHKSPNTQFTPLSLWRNKDLLLVRYQDWESDDKFLINLRTDSSLWLGSAYQISPDSSSIAVFISLGAAFYSGSASFAVIDISDGRRQALVLSPSLPIEELGWLSPTTIVFRTGDPNNSIVRSTKSWHTMHMKPVSDTHD